MEGLFSEGVKSSVFAAVPRRPHLHLKKESEVITIKLLDRR